jgi:capsular polysaccharide biosynthesis protein
LDRNSEQLKIDLVRLKATIRQRSRAMLYVGLGIFAVLTLFGLFFREQVFTSSVSIAIQHPASLGGGLAAGLGLASRPDTNYTGVIRSRRFAEEVEAKTHFQALYKIPTRRLAVEQLMRSIKVEDSQDTGLLTIQVTLAGPPRFAPGAVARRQLIEQKTADIANAYADALKNYMITTDVDRDSVLLRAAAQRERQARQDYELRFAQFARFINGHNERADAMLSPAAPDTNAGAEANTEAGGEGMGASLSSAGAELAGLYRLQRQNDLELKATLETQREGEALVAGQLNNLGGLPYEDPLLNGARNRVERARSTLNSLLIQQMPTSPDVVVAKQELQLAEADLRRQRAAIEQRRTTDQVTSDVKIATIRKKQEILDRQIAEAEHIFQTSRSRSADLQYLRGEVLISQEVLKQTLAHSAELALQAVSGKNRLAVVDSAIPPLRGQPSVTSTILLSLAVTLLVLSAWTLVAYTRAVPRVMVAERIASRRETATK